MLLNRFRCFISTVQYILNREKYATHKRLITFIHKITKKKLLSNELNRNEMEYLKSNTTPKREKKKPKLIDFTNTK